jgi:uroporphyrinogen decarboxylase
MSSLRKMVEVSKKRTVIIGNVATTLFQDGTEESMKEAVCECIEIAAPQSAFILSSGCEVPPTAPVQSVEWFMKAAREFGRHGDQRKEVSC